MSDLTERLMVRLATSPRTGRTLRGSAIVAIQEVGHDLRRAGYSAAADYLQHQVDLGIAAELEGGP
jgi:hypothetical protein